MPFFEDATQRNQRSQSHYEKPKVVSIIGASQERQNNIRHELRVPIFSHDSLDPNKEGQRSVQCQPSCQFKAPNSRPAEWIGSKRRRTWLFKEKDEKHENKWTWGWTRYGKESFTEHENFHRAVRVNPPKRQWVRPLKPLKAKTPISSSFIQTLHLNWAAPKEQQRAFPLNQEANRGNQLAPRESQQSIKGSLTENEWELRPQEEAKWTNGGNQKAYRLAQGGLKLV
jgi:hypothetical protein